MQFLNWSSRSVVNNEVIATHVSFHDTQMDS